MLAEDSFVHIAQGKKGQHSPELFQREIIVLPLVGQCQHDHYGPQPVGCLLDDAPALSVNVT